MLCYRYLENNYNGKTSSKNSKFNSASTRSNVVSGPLTLKPKNLKT